METAVILACHNYSNCSQMELAIHSNALYVINWVWFTRVVGRPASLWVCVQREFVFLVNTKELVACHNNTGIIYNDVYNMHGYSNVTQAFYQLKFAQLYSNQSGMCFMQLVCYSSCSNSPWLETAGWLSLSAQSASVWHPPCCQS